MNRLPHRAASPWASLAGALRLVVIAIALALGTPLHAQETVVTLDSAQTRIEFTLGATLHTVHGSFRLKSGEIRFDPGTGKASGKVVVDATSGESGNASRDKKMHREILESEKFAEIVFTPTQVKGALNPAAVSQLEVSGVFRLHGAGHAVTLDVAIQPLGTSQAGARQTKDQLQAATQFTIPYVQWGLKNPSSFLLRVSEKVDIEVHAVGKLTPAPQL
jgi:polyisoprenoid-binding protein YceI